MKIFAQVGAFPLSPGSFDCAVVTTLSTQARTPCRFSQRGYRHRRLGSGWKSTTRTPIRLPSRSAWWISPRSDRSAAKQHADRRIRDLPGTVAKLVLLIRADRPGAASRLPTASPPSWAPAAVERVRRQGQPPGVERRLGSPFHGRLGRARRHRLEPGRRGGQRLSTPSLSWSAAPTPRSSSLFPPGALQRQRHARRRRPVRIRAGAEIYMSCPDHQLSLRNGAAGNPAPL